MAKHEKRTDYRKQYPGICDDIIAALRESDWKMEYQQYNLKTERCVIDYTKQTVTYVPSREDSFDRLIEGERQFASEDESVEDIAVKAVMIEKMLACLKLLTLDERQLIIELFFKGKGEYQLSSETGIPRMTIRNRKKRILAHLKKLMEK